MKGSTFIQQNQTSSLESELGEEILSAGSLLVVLANTGLVLLLEDLLDGLSGLDYGALGQSVLSDGLLQVEVDGVSAGRNREGKKITIRDDIK